LQEFFDWPRKDFQMREISRRVRLAQVSVMRHLAALQKAELVVKEKKGIYPTFRANRENEDFRLLKMQNLVWRIHESGLVVALDERFRPNCIVLFGSGARGEDTETSDVDIFVQAEEKGIELEKYEKALNRKIRFLFEPRLKELGKELLNNIVNGHVIYGYLKVF